MGSLIRSDFLKLKKSSTFWVCMVISLLMGMLMAVLYYIVWVNIGSTLREQAEMMKWMGVESGTFEEALAVFPEPNVFEYANALLCDTNVLYIGAIVIGVFVGSEYSMGTVRNSISRGIQRYKLIISKFIVSSASMLFVVIAYVASGSLASVVMFGFSTDMGKRKMLLVLAAYFCLFIAAAVFYVMVAVLSRKTGRAIAISIVLPVIVETIIGMITFISAKDVGSFSRLWLFRTFVTTESMCLNGEFYVPFAVAAVYTLLCGTIAVEAFRHQEIK